MSHLEEYTGKGEFSALGTGCDLPDLPEYLSTDPLTYFSCTHMHTLNYSIGESIRAGNS